MSSSGTLERLRRLTLEAPRFAEDMLGLKGELWHGLAYKLISITADEGEMRFHEGAISGKHEIQTSFGNPGDDKYAETVLTSPKGNLS